MKVLMFNDRKDYDMSLPRYIQNSANSIIRADNKVAMIYVAKHKFYSFPGGGVESGETIIDALIRETQEETGLVIKPLSIVEFGKLVEIRKDNKVNGIYERHDHYYLCDIESETVPQRLTKNEITNEHRFMYVSIDEAIATNELHMRQGFNWTEGIICVLKKLKIL